MAKSLLEIYKTPRGKDEENLVDFIKDELVNAGADTEAVDAFSSREDVVNTDDKNELVQRSDINGVMYTLLTGHRAKVDDSDITSPVIMLTSEIQSTENWKSVYKEEVIPYIVENKILNNKE